MERGDRATESVEMHGWVFKRGKNGCKSSVA